MTFTTPEKVALFLNRVSLTPFETEQINFLIESIDGVVKNYCGWEILAKDYTAVLDGPGETTLRLWTYPINSVSLLEVGGTDLTPFAEISRDDGELYFPSTTGFSFTAGTRNIRIQYNAGYQTSPPDLTHAATYLVVLMFNRAILENVGVTLERGIDVHVEYDPTELPVLVRRVLDRYRVVKVY
jgi:hypothetical protein